MQPMGSQFRFEDRRGFRALVILVTLAVWTSAKEVRAQGFRVPVGGESMVLSAAVQKPGSQVHVPEFPQPPADLPPEDPTPYARWPNGPSHSPDYFPIAVWLQHPKNARAYKEAGINLYIGLWRGPTEEQLQMLREAGMPVICSLNDVARKHLNDPIIVGWMHGDEPDNAQPRRDGQPGWGPPIPPEKIIEDYQRIREIDPTRPVFLNLGQGVAWDRWHGRGVRTNHPEDYPLYVQGADIISFDIYPVVHEHPEVKGQLWYVPYGVARLRHWSNYQKIVWNCIECSRISNVNVKPTIDQIRAEVWMSIIHGSRGIIYFVHQFKPTFIEASLLADPELLAGVTRLNRQIHQLAPVLNSPTIRGLVSVESHPAEIPVAFMVKEHRGKVYIFAVSMRDKPTQATFRFLRPVPSGRIEVLDENRTLELKDGQFTDHFLGYQVHLYHLPL